MSEVSKEEVEDNMKAHDYVFKPIFSFTAIISAIKYSIYFPYKDTI